MNEVLLISAAILITGYLVYKITFSIVVKKYGFYNGGSLSDTLLNDNTTRNILENVIKESKSYITETEEQQKKRAIDKFYLIFINNVSNHNIDKNKILYEIGIVINNLWFYNF